MGILNIFFRKNISKNEIIKNIPKISNEQILQQLDALSISTKELLGNHNHKIAFSIFCYLFMYDLKLRTKISNYLTPNPDGNQIKGYSENEIPDVIELQSYFNMFRVSFLSDLTVYFTELYQVASEILEEETDRNITLSTQLFNAAHQLDKWYMNQIKERLAPKEDKNGPLNEQHVQLYDQCLAVLDVVKETGFLCFTKVLHANGNKFSTKIDHGKSLKGKFVKK